MQKKLLCVALFSSSLLLTGCDYFKSKQETAAVPEENNPWRCTSPEHIKNLEQSLKNEYLKHVDRRLRESKYYEPDQALLKTINDNLKFELKNIRTVSNEAESTSKLECESDLVVSLPKGLQERSENAYNEHGMDCEECYRRDEFDRLHDYLEEGLGLKLQNNQLSGIFSYQINKTDQDGYTLKSELQNTVLEGLSIMVVKAVQYAAYIKENKDSQEDMQKYDQEAEQLRQLSQKAMDIRAKELVAEKATQVERLNQTWDNLSEEQQDQLKQDQSSWFEKRDVDCKVIAQKRVGQLHDSEREVYQQQYDYWNDEMRAQNTEMQYNKCFNQKTAERRVYLNNLFN